MVPLGFGNTMTAAARALNLANPRRRERRREKREFVSSQVELHRGSSTALGVFHDPSERGVRINIDIRLHLCELILVFPRRTTL